MRKVSFLALVGAIALVTSGCSSGGGGNEATSSASPTASQTNQQTTAQNNPSFAKPVVAGKAQATPDAAKDKATPPPVAVPSPELIAPTDPKAQVNKMQKGQKDPFAQPPIQLETPPPTTPTADKTPKPVPTVRSIPGSEGTPTVKVPTRINPRLMPDPEALRAPAAPRPKAVRRIPVRVKIPPTVEVKSPDRPAEPSPFALQPPRSPVRRVSVQPLTRPDTPRSVASAPQRSTATPTRAVRVPQRYTVYRGIAIARTPQRPNPTRTTVVTRTRPARTSRTTVAVRTRPTTTSRTTVAVRTRPTTTSQTTVAARPSTTASTTNQSGVNQASPPSTVATPAATPVPTVTPDPQIAPLPSPPEPTLARSVEVSGVIQVGNEPQAIIKAPNESTSRYVRVGQRLSNGQVLVKRIEMNEGSEPVVVLEQNGVEVAKAVGERAPVPAQPGQQPANPAAAATTILLGAGALLASRLSKFTNV